MKKVARWVSILAHPFVMVAILVAEPTARQASGKPFTALMTIAVAVLLPLAALMFHQVRRGRWSNVDASQAASCWSGCDVQRGYAHAPEVGVSCFSMPERQVGR